MLSVYEGKQIVFVTNNSTKSRSDYKKKLTDMGIPAAVNEVFGSSYSAAVYISRILKLPADKNRLRPRRNRHRNRTG
ncbi:hypothetical protein ABVK25_004370 [Lepraria finkii]|uniref:Phosphoglycolate phosphatase n=1 Tax=Lepraria finkii TaxID=1340010 RepID=A0ABR4BDP7_9LECA